MVATERKFRFARPRHRRNQFNHQLLHDSSQGLAIPVVKLRSIRVLEELTSVCQIDQHQSG